MKTLESFNPHYIFNYFNKELHTWRILWTSSKISIKSDILNVSQQITWKISPKKEKLAQNLSSNKKLIQNDLHVFRQESVTKRERKRRHANEIKCHDHKSSKISSSYRASFCTAARLRWRDMQARRSIAGCGKKEDCTLIYLKRLLTDLLF